MITEAVANWFLGLVATVVGWLPSMSPDTEQSVSEFSGRIDQVVDFVGKFGPIIPFSEIGLASLVLLSFVAIALLLQVSRIVLSVITLGGGGV